MAETIIDGTLFNVENIRYSSPKVNPSGGKSVNILSSDTKSGLRISTPLMLTWGASDFEGNLRYEMALQFPNGEYSTEDTTLFLTKMKAFEGKIKADAITFSKEWFGKVHKSSEVVDALFTPMLKYSKDKFSGEPDLSKSPTLKVKLPLWEGVWNCLICDEEGQKLFPGQNTTPLDFIKKGTNLAIIMQCGGLWFANGKFGVTWKLVQAVVQKPKASLLDECLIKLKPTDKARLKALPPVDTDERDDHIVGTIVDDSDDEDIANDQTSVFETAQSTIQKVVVEEQVQEEIAELGASANVPVTKKKIVKKKSTETSA